MNDEVFELLMLTATAVSFALQLHIIGLKRRESNGRSPMYLPVVVYLFKHQQL